MTDPAIAVIHYLSGAYNAMLYDLDRTEANQARTLVLSYLEQACVAEEPVDAAWYARSCERARLVVIARRVVDSIGNVR